MAKLPKLCIFVLVLLISFWKCHSLRCQMEDGPSEEELKRVVRICMRKLGDDSDRNNSGDSYEESNEDDSNENSRRNTKNRSRNNNNSNNSSNRGNRFARDMDRWQHGYDNSYANNNQQRYGDGNSYGNNNNGGNYGNDYGNYENNRNHNMSHQNRNTNENDGDDKSCMIQCFFQEMKMTNSDGFPEKHKVERLVTQDVRDREMKSFLLDSIQECFHIVEMERRRDKCVFSKNIVSCLAERAKANCDDYYNETMIF